MIIHVEITHHGRQKYRCRAAGASERPVAPQGHALPGQAGGEINNELQSLTSAFSDLFGSLAKVFGDLLLPSRLNQIAALALCAAAARLLGRWAAPRVRAWLKSREGWPKWRLRLALLLERRLQLIWFVILTWTVAAVIAANSPFPSRRYLVTLGATIATAWLVVALASRLIANRLLRRIVTWGLWVYVTLYYLGLADDVSSFLDRHAISFGDFRLSALAIIKALAVTGALLAGARYLTATGARRVSGNAETSPSMQVLAIKGPQIVLYGLALFIGLKAVGFNLTGLAFLSGAIGVGLGFGLQKVVSNLVSGVIILLDKSVKPGDVISLGDTFGWIESLGARAMSASSPATARNI